ncbi:hypothetical protein [Pseudodesulfovibrio sp. zrk46]|uniref:DUF7660 family protein n=1 Tax=Pseudodesulfovibrio sp. zrk46 TaxID=2725288 RepID=UPI001449C69B|nr:hypothetical protein [Pseudodesulfovibrio sp. zrk46]QJB56028.1 hypothetical protein HFN16_06205 [Pseudodesulfovibrio sp. zrk46]
MMLPKDVFTNHDLARFIAEMAEEVGKPECNWENDSLPRFLEAMAAWSENFDGYYKFHGIDMNKEPKWRLFADLLMAGTMYE